MMRNLLLAFIAITAIYIPSHAQTVTRTTTVTQNISCPNWTNYRASDISFTTADFPTNTLIADVNVIIDFDGRDGDEMNFMLYSENGAGTESTSLVDGNEGGENCAGSSFAETSASSVSRRTITFDEDAANFADGTIPANGSTVNSTCSNLDFEKWETMELNTTTDWWLRVGMAPNCTGGSGQTTIFSFGVQITGCKYASYGSATASRTVICVGGNSVLSHNGGVNTIDAQGFGDQLRWYSGSCGGTLVGTGNNLTVSPTSTTTYYAQYWIDGQPCGGGSTSGCASVTVTVVPDPSISASGGGTVCVGGNRTLSASTSGGTGTCTYQWQISTSGTGGPWTNISGATSSTYNTGSLTSTRYYRVRRICNGSGCGDPYSNVLTVTVVADPSITASGAGTICVGGSRTLSSSTSGGTGTCTYQWQISSAGSGGPFSNISGATSSTYNTGALGGNRWYRVVRNCNGSGCNDPTSNVVAVTVVNDPTISASGGATICVGGSRTLSSATSGGVSCGYQWQISTAGSSGPWSNISGATSSTYNTGALTSSRWYRVQRICTGTGCSDPYSSVVTVTVVADPTISASGSGTVCVGGSQTLSSSTSGGVSCSFQWQVSTSGTSGPWSNISGATSSTYNTGALSSTRWYRVRRVCTGSGCSDPYSNILTVTVVADPSITASGTGTVCSGGNRTLSSSTSGGTGTCTYQWQISTAGSSGPYSNIGGATSSTYNTGALTSTRWYRVVRNCTGSGCNDPTSNVVTVTVVPDPTISAAGGGAICVGGNRTLSTSTSGGVSCSYQWQISTSSSTGPWSNISGATGSTYNTGTLISSTWYRVQRICAGTGCSDPYSNSVAVTVVPDPTISASGGGTICVGGSQTLNTAISGGTGSCSYQWQVSTAGSGGPFSSISGATSSTYNTGALTSTRWYRVVRTCSGTGCNSFTSNVVVVTVVADPTISASGGGTICTGGNSILTSSTSGGTGTCTYQWQISSSGSSGPFSNIGGATSSSYNTGTLTSSRWYRVVRNCTGGGCNDPTSNVVAVNVVADPTISASGSTTICTGGNQTITSSTSGGVSCSYQWQISTAGSSGPWSSIGGATGPTYNTGAITSTTWYRVRRNCTGAGCSDPYSNAVTITVDQNPTVSNAGTNQTVCATTATLAGNTPAVGSGTWTLISGTGSITTPGSPNSGVTGLGVGANTFRWTIGNGVCPSSTDDVIITRDAVPSTSNAGGDLEACINLPSTMAATAPATGTGVWTWSPSAPSYTGGTNANDHDAQVVFASAGAYTGTWTVSNGVCPPSTDDAIVNVKSAATNVALSSGASITATAVCVESPWTYYADPSNPDEYLFAIAKNGNSFTASVTLTDVPGTAPIESIGGQPNVRGTWLISRYWNVDIGSSTLSSPVSIRFFIDDAERTAALAAADAFVLTNPWPTIPINRTSLQWFKTNGVDFNPNTDVINGEFQFNPTYLVPSDSGFINSIKYYEFDGITSFSGGTGGFSVNDGSPSPLPVELLTFEARAIDNQYIRLDWATATEINNDGFEVLRSTDGVNFERIAWVDGNGNSTVLNEYDYSDYDVVKGQTYYYQLRQIDFDGQFELFDIVSARLSASDDFVIGNLIPNPSKDNDVVSVNVFASIQAEEVITIELYNHVGVKVLQNVRTLANGDNNLEINIRDLASGTYFMNFESSFGIETRKLVIIR